MSKSVLILGAASDIGLALARDYALRGHRLILAARGGEARLATDLADLRVRAGAQADVRAVEFDILDQANHAAFLDGLSGSSGLPDIVVCVVGLLGDQKQAETDPAHAELVIRSNYTAPALFLDLVAARMETRKSGQIIGISSVAGDRGRASNYVYGSAKAGFTAFLSGLRNRLAKSDVRVLTVKPGFVRTKMTAGMKLPAPLTAEPGQVSAAILKAQDGGKDVLYVLPVWWLVMSIIRAIPERMFKRMKI